MIFQNCKHNKEVVLEKVYQLIEDGCEMVEAMAVVDVLRRAGIDTVTVSVNGKHEVLSSHKVVLGADTLFEENDYEDADVLFLPGGMPGTRNLEAHQGLVSLLKQHNAQEKLLAAICAAPSVYGHLGFLNGKKAPCYPGFEKALLGAEYVPDRVVKDGNIITSRGMGTAIDLGLRLVSVLISQQKADDIAKAIQYII